MKKKKKKKKSSNAHKYTHNVDELFFLLLVRGSLGNDGLVGASARNISIPRRRRDYLVVNKVEEDKGLFLWRLVYGVRRSTERVFNGLRGTANSPFCVEINAKWKRNIIRTREGYGWWREGFRQRHTLLLLLGVSFSRAHILKKEKSTTPNGQGKVDGSLKINSTEDTFTHKKEE